MVKKEKRKKEEVDKKLDEIKAGATPGASNPADDKVGGPGKPGDKRKRRTKQEILDEKYRAELGRLPQEANPLLIPVISGLFTTWAKGVKVEDLKLTEDEVNNLALPITQLMAYYLPNMPPIVMAWGSLGANLYGVMSVRLELLAKIRKENDKNKGKKGPITNLPAKSGPKKAGSGQGVSLEEVNSNGSVT